MSAEDVSDLFSEVRPLINTASKAHEGDKELDKTQEDLVIRKLQNIKDASHRVAKTGELLQSQYGMELVSQLGVTRGHLGNCMKRQKNCKRKPGRMLGEGVSEGQRPEDHDWIKHSWPKHTAIEEDMIKRGEEHPAAHIKAKHVWQQETETAHAEYKRSQSGPIWAQWPHAPGEKLPWDRMTKDDVDQLLAEVQQQVQRTQALAKRENDRIQAKVQDANTKAIQGSREMAADLEEMAKMRAGPTAEKVLAEMRVLDKELFACMYDVRDNCVVEATPPGPKKEENGGGNPSLNEEDIASKTPMVPTQEP